jgi:hypothetical protein
MKKITSVEDNIASISMIMRKKERRRKSVQWLTWGVVWCLVATFVAPDKCGFWWFLLGIGFLYAGTTA